MAAGDQGKQIAEYLQGIFHWGSRYHAEKVGVITGFVVLSAVTLFWAFSGPDDTNELGAEVYLRDSMVGFELIVENTGRSGWQDVRIVLDRRYLFEADEIPGGDYVSLSADTVIDAYYIPRPWGRDDWEELGDETQRAGRRPPATYEPEFVQVRAQEGRIDMDELEQRGD